MQNYVYNLISYHFKYQVNVIISSVKYSTYSTASERQRSETLLTHFIQSIWLYFTINYIIITGKKTDLGSGIECMCVRNRPQITLYI